MSFTNLHCTCTCIDVPLHKNWNTLLNPLQINFWWLCWNHQIWRYNILYTCSVKLLHAIMVFFFHKIFPVLYTCTSIWYEDLRLLSFFCLKKYQRLMLDTKVVLVTSDVSWPILMPLTKVISIWHVSWGLARGNTLSQNSFSCNYICPIWTFNKQNWPSIAASGQCTRFSPLQSEFDPHDRQRFYVKAW